MSKGFPVVRKTGGWLFLAAGLALSAAAQTPRYMINAFAGTGTGAFAGDADVAGKAQIYNPWGITFDGDGALYIADQFNSRIRKIGTDGKINTVGGTGTYGFSGDAGAATSANLAYPAGIAVSSAKDIYFADTQNHRIRKITSGGTISTFAGNGTAGFAGDGDVATSASLDNPTGIALDAAGNLYIADTMNHRVRKVGTDGKISTVAGNGWVGFGGDGGAATSAKLNFPRGVAVDAAGNLFIADTANHRIRKVDKDGNIATVAGSKEPGFAGDGGLATAARLNHPRSAVPDAAGNLYISDTFNARIRRVTADGRITTICGNGQFNAIGDDGWALQSGTSFPSMTAVRPDGKIYLADTQNNRIRVLTPVAQQGANALPVVDADGVAAAIDFGGERRLAPGTWVEIRGTGLAAAARSWTTADFDGMSAPTELEGTRVTVGGLPAYLSFVSPGQVNAQLPLGLAAGEQVLTVATAQGESAPVAVVIDPAQAGLAAPAALNVGGRQYAAAVLADGVTLALPRGAVAGVESRPARAGETIELEGIGFGPVLPDVAAGVVAPAESMLAAAVEVRIGGVRAEVVSAGLAPGKVGMYRLRVVVPAVAAGAAAVEFTLGGTESKQTVAVAVE